MRFGGRTTRLAALLLCLAAAPQIARASTVIYRTDAELIARSARVVHGRVVGQRTVWGGRDGTTIYTVTTLSVVEDFTGEAGDIVEVWELGGTIGNYFQYVGGAVEFEPGRDVIVCLERGPHGLRTLAMGFSKFDVSPAATGGGRLSRNVQGMMIVGGRAPERERTVDEFRALAEQVTHRRSVRRPEPQVGDYQASISERFTKLGGEPGWRWSQADSGIPVHWYKNTSAPNPLVSGDAVNEIQTALAAWTNPASASIILEYSGTTLQSNPKGSWVGLGNGDALISFEDPNNELSGSVLAIGGGDGFIGTGGTVNGTTFNGFAHGYVIFQNAADLPSSFRQSLNFSRVLEHEVGHGIGLGHTQADGSVPNPSSNIMYASCCATETPVPPALGPDDLAGINFIYPAIVCTYAISPTNVNVGPGAATGSVTVTTQTGCSWTAASNSPFLTVNAGSSGTGNGTVGYGIAANGPSYRSGTITIAGQTFTVSQTGAGPTMSLDKTSLRFGATTAGASIVAQTPSQLLRLSQSGAGTVTWTASSSQPWLTVSPTSGTGPTSFSVGIVPTGTLPSAGTLTGSVTVTLSGAATPLQPVAVTLTLMPSGTSAGPFGSVDTPPNNSVGIAGAVPFTGWGLDDVGVARIGVCRAAVTGESAPIDGRCGGAAQIFIGDGVFIEGARPDVVSAYPGYPANNVAGWGLLVLTNMLPYQGNGTFVFYMYLEDRDAHTVLLGTRTITCDNAHATAPFGTIDTPGQGGVASGSAFVNFGWALTPQPKTIPFDGSTINVFIDGVPIGNPVYNNYRGDVAAFFPGLNNSNGAIGYKVIDTTALANGVHTIAWGVVDNNGAAAGLGSRFFVVSNTSSPSALTAASTAAVSTSAAELAPQPLTLSPSRSMPLPEEIAAASLDGSPLSGRRGWDPDAPLQSYQPTRSGRVVVRGEEVDRLELRLGDGPYSGYLRVGAELAAIPAGSRLDASSGVFTWQPGVGFVGSYDLVFVKGSASGALSRREVRVVLAPKNSGRVGPQVVIDTPGSQVDVGQPFLLAGWAVDLDSDDGTGIDTLHVWAYPLTGGAPVFVGVASYGGVRPDVAAIHGDRFRESGFGLVVQGLTPGNYDLAVFPWSSVTGGFGSAQVVRVTVR